MDAHTEQHTASYIHSLPDSNAASHHNPNTHAYAAPYVDGVSDADTRNTKSNLDRFANAYAASDAYPHVDPNPHIHSDTHGDRNTLKL